MTDPLRKAAEGLLADARKPRKHARLGDIPVSAGLLHILEISLLQRGEGWTPQIEFNADAGFYEFVSEDVPAVWRPFAPHIEVCVSMKDRGRVIGMRVFADGTPFDTDPLATAINRYAGPGRELFEQLHARLRKLEAQ